MQIGPLVTIAKLRVPAFTNLFSDTVPVTSMDVVAGDVITLTCSAPHGLAVGRSEWLSITQALAPNPITALTDETNGDVTVTVQYPHNLTASAAKSNMFASYQGFATLSVPGTAPLTGAIQLVSVTDRTTFTVRPGTHTLPVSVPADAVLLEPLEIEIVGLNSATATSATELTMPTPATVTRDYTVTSPTVVRNLRMFGAYDYHHAATHVVDATPVPGRCYLYICPVATARMSRDWQSASDALMEITPNAAYRAKLLDGFDIFAFIATQSMAAGVAAMDKASGEVLRAVVQTFNGIKLPWTEWAERGRYSSILLNHGKQAYDKAMYVHRYSFESIVQLAAQDLAQPYALPNLETISDPAFDPTVPVPPVGTVPAETLALDGLYHDNDDPYEPLTATVPLDTP